LESEEEAPPELICPPELLEQEEDTSEAAEKKGEAAEEEELPAEEREDLPATPARCHSVIMSPETMTISRALALSESSRYCCACYVCVRILLSGCPLASIYVSACSELLYMCLHALRPSQARSLAL